MSGTPVARSAGVVARLCAATVLSMSTWFSATAVAPAVRAEWGLDSAQSAWLIVAVQLGFVAGTLASAAFLLTDRVEARLVFAVSSLAAAITNGMLAFSNGIAMALPWRFLNGVCLAGVYPPAMKLASSWYRQGRGLAVGAVIGALTLGSAAPHAVGAAALDGLHPIPWRTAILVVSLLSAAGSLIVFFSVKDGPFSEGTQGLDPTALREILARPGLRLANLGYLGHMWELYAMWAWVPAFLLEVFDARYGREGATLAAGASFLVIAAGGPGSVVAGYLADRWGRTTVVIASLTLSGACCLLTGSLGAEPLVVVGICVIWGFSVVADSAQFSTMVTELAPRRLTGTALTLQTCLGFLLTTVSLRALPWIRGRLGWSQAFALLALGPLIGIGAMIALRRSPESAAIALGRK